MAGNETIIDAPITPAPIFAYRALRGILFGSPDTPAVATNLYEKPGIVRADRASPTKMIHLEAQIRLTPPQKRKRDSNAFLSPTKSCLRTPGAVTPRRAMLRDVTVTFKDPRMSIGPELSRKSTEVHNMEANKENQKPMTEKIMTTTIVAPNTTQHVKVARPTVSVPITSKRKPPTTTKDRVAHSDFDLEEYMAKTDGEMKKLIRYSRKMRDYARKQDDENTKLRDLIAELQQENEHLRRESISRDGSLDATGPIERAGMIAPQDKRRIGSAATTTKTTTTAATNNLLPLNAYTRLELNELLNLEKPSDMNGIHPTDPMRKHISNTSTSNPSTNLDSVPKSKSNSTTTTMIPPSHPNPTQIHTQPPERQNHHLHLPILNPTSSTRLASDRLSAARARIQKKAELRKSSSESVSVPSHTSHPAFDLDIETVGATGIRKEGNLDSRTETVRGKERGKDSIPIPNSRENSLVDWAAL